MTNHTYTIKKSKYNGWEAETDIDLGAIEYGGKPANRVLTISTSKNSSKGALSTFANVSIIRDEGGYKMRTTAIFSDFSGYVQHEPGKATEKAIRTAHEKALLRADELTQQAQNYYAQGKDKQ